MSCCVRLWNERTEEKQEPRAACDGGLCDKAENKKINIFLNHFCTIRIFNFIFIILLFSYSKRSSVT